MRLPKTAPTWNDLNRDELINSVTLNQIPGIEELIQRSNHNYLHWDKFRYQSIPDGFSHKALWLALERIRKAQQQCLPLELADDTKLWYWTPPLHQMWLHRIDQDAGGYVGSRSRLVPQDSDDRFLFNSLMEEAIASSQLEGATTTRPVAKMLLRTKRKPKDRHERMILNNYTAILNIRDMRNEQLTPEMLCAIQEIITYKTLDREDAAGRFKDSRDGNVCVVDAHTGEMLFEPPGHHHTERLIDDLCDFANGNDETFIHPAVKAIALHFMLGYIHPFADGNGRTARAVFYWYMLKKGYWIFEYLPISRIVLDAPVQYARAYRYTESDGADLTYFIHYKLRVIDRAVREMHEYFARQQVLMRTAREAVESLGDLNHRQIAVAYDAIQDRHAVFSIRDHAGAHAVTPATARADLLGLEEHGLLRKYKRGKRWEFTPATHLKQRLHKGSIPPDVQ